MSGSLRTKSSVSAPVRGSSGSLFQTPFLPQELKTIHELENQIKEAEVTDASLADLQKELNLVSSIANSRIQMLKYCHIPVLGKSLMEDTKIAEKQQDLDIDDMDVEEIRKSYSNWRQGGAVGTAVVQTPKTTSQVTMPSTAIYLRYFLQFSLFSLLFCLTLFLSQSITKARFQRKDEFLWS